MDKKYLKEKRRAIIDEYKKGTKIETIMGFFNITKGGIYWILKTNGVKLRKNT